MITKNNKLPIEHFRSIKLTRRLSGIRIKSPVVRDTVRGRILDVTESSLYIADQNGINEILAEKNSDFENGDLVAVIYEKIRNKKIAHTITLEQKVRQNPLDVKRSAFNLLTDNSYRLKNILQQRNLYFKGLHNFFGTEGFIEVNTPTLVESPGVEKYLGVFKTEYIDTNNEPHTFYLPTSPEFSLKESLTSGLEKVYEICKCFRNAGERSDTHRPEFMMLEWYRTNVDYTKIIDDCAKLALYSSILLNNEKNCNFKGHRIDLSKYQVFTLRELFEKHGINLDDYSDKPDEFSASVRKILNITGDGLTNEDLFFKFMLEKIEPNLGFECPTFICEYPYAMTPLSERSEKNPLYGKRFEMYICGVELANGYGELTDPGEQKKRFEEVMKERQEIGYPELPYPERFISAMKQGIMQCSGVALGTERLFMILTDTPTIAGTKIIDMF